VGLASVGCLVRWQGPLVLLSLSYDDAFIQHGVMLDLIPCAVMLHLSVVLLFQAYR
jgi:hypothetical protein